MEQTARTARTAGASDKVASISQKARWGNIESVQSCLQEGCPRISLKPAKIATNERPPFSAPNASKPLSSLLCPFESFSEPATIYGPVGLSKAGVPRSKAPDTEGMRQTLGVTLIFLSKKGDLWKRLIGAGEEEVAEKDEEESERFGF